MWGKFKPRKIRRQTSSWKFFSPVVCFFPSLCNVLREELPNFNNFPPHTAGYIRAFEPSGAPSESDDQRRRRECAHWRSGPRVWPTAQCHRDKYSRILASGIRPLPPCNLKACQVDPFIVPDKIKIGNPVLGRNPKVAPWPKQAMSAEAYFPWEGKGVRM